MKSTSFAPVSVFYVGYLWRGSTCVPRLQGLRSLGLDVTEFDATAWVGGGRRVAKVLAHRVYATSSVRAMNGALVAAVAKAAPDVVWLEKGTWVYPSTLRVLRAHARFLVHYNTDDVFGRGNWFWLHRAGIRMYDVHLTTNRWNVLELRARYGVRTFRAGMGYDQDAHLPVPSAGRNPGTADIVFVGHWEPHTERYISALHGAGLRVEVWGHNWRKAKDRRLRSVRPLPSSDYARTIGTSKIALCVLSRWNRNESTGRSFEIPAMGTLLLAERTAEHEYLYGDGCGAALFADEKELIEKAKYYLEDEERRESVARDGLARCQSMGMSWRDHIRREWLLIEKVFAAGHVPAFTKEDDFPFWMGFRAGSPWDKTATSS